MNQRQSFDQSCNAPTQGDGLERRDLLLSGSSLIVASTAGAEALTLQP